MISTYRLDFEGRERLRVRVQVRVRVRVQAKVRVTVSIWKHMIVSELPRFPTYSKRFGKPPGSLARSGGRGE